MAPYLPRIAILLAVCGCAAAEVPAWRPPMLDVPPPASAPPPPAPEHDKAKVDELPKPTVDPPRTIGPKSQPLDNGLFNPMPGGVMAGYRGDTGLDIAGNRMPVYAIAAGTLDYSEPGHTLWTGPGDTDNAVRLELDEPIPFGDRKVTHVWYAHLSSLAFEQARDTGPTGGKKRRPRIHVEAGELLGVSGVANKSPHLHLGLLLDGVTTQRWGSYLLEDEVRIVLGGPAGGKGVWRRGQRLPAP